MNWAFYLHNELSTIGEMLYLVHFVLGQKFFSSICCYNDLSFPDVEQRTKRDGMSKLNGRGGFDGQSDRQVFKELSQIFVKNNSNGSEGVSPAQK